MSIMIKIVQIVLLCIWAAVFLLEVVLIEMYGYNKFDLIALATIRHLIIATISILNILRYFRDKNKPDGEASRQQGKHNKGER